MFSIDFLDKMKRTLLTQQRFAGYTKQDRRENGWKKNSAVELLVESVNYILLHYALSNMLLLLLFASQIWVTVRYWNTARARSRSSWMAWMLLLICTAVHLALFYFIGRAVGEVVPFLVP